MQAPRRGRPFRPLFQSACMSFGSGVFIEATVGVVTAKHYWRVQRSRNSWSDGIQPFFAGPIVAMVMLRWVPVDDPKWAATITERLEREGSGR
ncbi:hypothetical protein [Singulisphaera sp. PoT]|uniref:hypothetical protein n=1 Tax=Singulisphaera sp. PoT TaxID=3411797 RepID=UPI003BF5ABC8